MKLPKSKLSLSLIIILCYILAVPIVDFNHHYYSRNEGVIIWDVKSYYAYLPATIIYKDLSLSFTDRNPDKFNKWIWPITTPTGKKAILTTMGLSILYSPFFLIAHGYTFFSGKYEADGYSYPYHVALTFSAYLYFILALFILRKILLKHFTDVSTAITLLAIGAGTNLFYYITYEAPMSHGYNFFLIILFIYLLERWYEKYSWKYTLLLGLTAGLISLIRPTNSIVLVLIPLYKVNSFYSFKQNIVNLLRLWPRILLMAVCFSLVWLPQFLYWYIVAGKFFYFSYGEVGSAFYFNNPQIFNILFSYGKGWYIYTPIMLLATIGIYTLFHRKHDHAFAVLIYYLICIYILSSWWSWWYGGGFSNRAFIDFYGIMAFPLAAFIEQNRRIMQSRIVVLILIGVLTFYNLFQIQQYRKGSLHWFWMNKEAYWESFLRLNPSCKYWNILNHPDVEKARQGIYEMTSFIDTKITYEDLFKRVYEKIEADTAFVQSLQTIPITDTSLIKQFRDDYIKKKIDQGLAKAEYKELRMEYLMHQMKICGRWNREIQRKAEKRNVTFNQMSAMEAERIFEKYSQPYVFEVSK